SGPGGGLAPEEGQRRHETSPGTLCATGARSLSKRGHDLCPSELTNRVMTLFTSLGASAECRGQTQVPKYQVQTWNARTATFAFSQRGSLLRWGLQGKVTRTPHQRKGGHQVTCHFRWRRVVGARHTASAATISAALTTVA